MIWQVAQSPLFSVEDDERKNKNGPQSICENAYTSVEISVAGTEEGVTYLLQEYFGLTPNCRTAFFKGDPALKFFFFPRKVNTVICNEEDEDTFVDGALVVVVKASVERQATRASRMVKKVFMVIF